METIQGNLEVYQLCHIPFGIVCNPFILAATIKFHLNQYSVAFALHIRDNILLHIDNVMVEVISAEEAYKDYVEAKRIFQEASMNL